LIYHKNQSTKKQRVTSSKNESLSKVCCSNWHKQVHDTITCWFLRQHPLQAFFLQSSILLVKKSNYNLSHCRSATAHILLARLTLKSTVQQKQLRKSMTNDYLVYIGSLNNLLIATFIHNLLIPFSLTHWRSKENKLWWMEMWHQQFERQLAT